MNPGLDIIVTRHPATVEWLRQQLSGQRRQVVLPHLDRDLLTRPHWQGRPLDWRHTRFFGVFPLWLAADIAMLGGQCWSVDLANTLCSRGAELNLTDLNQCRPTLVRYRVIALDRMVRQPPTPNNGFAPNHLIRREDMP